MVYTTQDYIDILKSLLKEWNIENIAGMNDSAEEARKYLMALPKRLQRIVERIKIPKKQFEFKWIASSHTVAPAFAPSVDIKNVGNT